MSQRVSKEIVDEIGELNFPNETLLEEARRTVAATQKTVVLGQTRLKAVQEDIDATIVPNWVGYVPRNFGTAAAGKLTADVLRWANTIYLPITLIRLWGHLPVETRERQILDCTMWMILAVELLSSRVMNLERAQDAALAYREYTYGLRRLWPDLSLQPCHHYMFHLLDLLPYIGPIANWNAFVYERNIGIMQRIQTNNRPSKSEVLQFKSIAND